MLSWLPIWPATTWATTPRPNSRGSTCRRTRRASSPGQGARLDPFTKCTLPVPSSTAGHGVRSGERHRRSELSLRAMGSAAPVVRVSAAARDPRRLMDLGSASSYSSGRRGRWLRNQPAQSRLGRSHAPDGTGKESAAPGGWHHRTQSPEARSSAMAGNKAVAYKGPGKVEVIDIDYPTFELKDGPGVNPANVGRKVPPRRDPQDRRHQHLRLRPAHGPRPHHRAGRPGARPRDHRRGGRGRPGRRVHQGRRHRARCRSTSPAAAAATARRARPASA